MDWTGIRVLVTGGASFIGSHLVDALVARGADVSVVDDFSSGKLENIQEHVDAGRVRLVVGDLFREVVVIESFKRQQVVFHLAADHGGRGYVDLHQAACSTNLGLDALVFRACREAGVEKIVYASSGCVYPNHLQADPSQAVYLSEDMAGPPYDADNLYGWAKLMGELSLRAYYRDYGLKSAVCRYFTVYGERGIENHAVMAMIARAFVRQDPFVVWGTGKQVRNWTHVSDIVAGTILAAEQIDDATPVNLGTMERTRVIDAAREVLSYTYQPDTPFEFRPDMPTGPANRVADNMRARALLGWEPKVKFIDGLHRTIDWYYATHERAVVSARLEAALTER